MSLNLNSIKNKKVNIFLFMILTLIVLLFQLVSIGRNKYLEYIGFIIMLPLSFLVSKENLLSMIMFLLPNNQYINIGQTSIITIIVTIYLLKAVMINKEKINVAQMFFGILLIIYSMFFYNLGAISFAIKTFIFLFFCDNIFSDKRINKKKIYINGIQSLTLGIIISSLITIIINPYMLDRRFSLTTEQSTNTLAILSIFALANILMMIQNKHFVVGKLWSCLSFLLIVIGILTRSKTFIFGCLIVLIWMLIFSTYKHSEKSKIIKLLIFIVLLFIITINIKPEFTNLIVNVIDRVINPKHGDISTGRLNIWRAYFNKISTEGFVLLFGSGTNMNQDIGMLPHNLYIEQLYLFGIIGYFLIIPMFIITAKSIYKNNSNLKVSLYGVLPIVLILVISFFTHSFIGGADTITFFLAIVAAGMYIQNGILDSK